MTTHDVWMTALAFVVGLCIGGAYFVSLWFAVKRSLHGKYAALWVTLSLPLRLGLATVGFYFASGGDSRRLLSCLTGFVVARLMVSRGIRRTPSKTAKSTEEVEHAH